MGLALGTAACTGHDDTPPRPKPVSAAKVCEGALSPAAATSLESLTGAKRFQADSAKDDMAKAADALAPQYVPGSATTPGDEVPVCSIRNATSDLHEPYLDVSVLFTDDKDLKTSADIAASPDLEGEQYRDEGHVALASGRFAELYFLCVSPELKTSSQKVPGIVATVLEAGPTLRGKTPQRSATEAVRRANLTVLHSIAYRMAQQLGCQGNAGLRAQPALTQPQGSA
jgi:hypothetical protein